MSSVYIDFDFEALLCGLTVDRTLAMYEGIVFQLSDAADIQLFLELVTLGQRSVAPFVEPLSQLIFSEFAIA